MAENSASSSTGDTVLKLGVAGAAAYIAWRYVYLPYKLKSDLEAQAAYQQRMHPGMSRGDALQAAAGIVCQAIAAGQAGIPPQLSAGLCGQVGQIATGLIRNAPAITRELARAQVSVLTLPVRVAGGVVKEIGKPLVTAGKAVGSFFSRIF